MIDKKIFVYSTDSTISIVEGVYNYQDSIIKIQSKKAYFKSKFFVNHSKILESLLIKSDRYQAVELKTNLPSDSEIYRLISDHVYKISNSVLTPNYKIKLDRLKQTHQHLINSNYQDINYQDRILEKRMLSELNQKFDDLSDHSFLCFYNACVPQELTIYQPSLREQLKSKQAAREISIEPIFGGVLTNRELTDIFL